MVAISFRFPAEFIIYSVYFALNSKSVRLGQVGTCRNSQSLIILARTTGKSRSSKDADQQSEKGRTKSGGSIGAGSATGVRTSESPNKHQQTPQMSTVSSGGKGGKVRIRGLIGRIFSPNSEKDDENKNSSDQPRKTSDIEISTPYNTVHRVHVGYDGKKFSGLPQSWMEILLRDISEADQKKNPTAVVTALKFYAHKLKEQQSDKFMTTTSVYNQSDEDDIDVQLSGQVTEHFRQLGCKDSVLAHSGSSSAGSSVSGASTVVDAHPADPINLSRRTMVPSPAPQGIPRSGSSNSAIPMIDRDTLVMDDTAMTSTSSSATSSAVFPPPPPIYPRNAKREPPPPPQRIRNSTATNGHVPAPAVPTLVTPEDEDPKLMEQESKREDPDATILAPPSNESSPATPKQPQSRIPPQVPPKPKVSLPLY
ncbi:hypothetical protein WR25_22113 [Diploscapter pachys]|uniref:CRIB domain-containing protein n=1 Tax=Diploscapter pachys TaxID=2018661 RepID=A0A2A2LBS2_9BILA|nr:hypothetical protein WR25_22113 [Diploscapter pachys]